MTDAPTFSGSARPCPVCGGPVPEQDSAGPPRRFCTKSCQRAAALERGRINRRLSKLEETHDRYKRGSTWERSRAPHYAEQIAELKGRLLELL